MANFFRGMAIGYCMLQSILKRLLVEVSQPVVKVSDFRNIGLKLETSTNTIFLLFYAQELNHSYLILLVESLINNNFYQN